jgi:hypothetical protein
MPAETFTKTTVDVSDRVRTTFGDTSGAQVTDAMMIRWINDGQQEIINNNPVLKGTKYSDYIAEQTEYTFPTDAVQFIEAVYVDGRPIKNLSPQEYREYILQMDPEVKIVSDYPAIWYERNGVITFYPKATKTYTNGLKLEYVKTPAAINSISSSTLLTIPDRYLNQLVDYVLAQALELDENYSAAQYKQAQFRDGLDRLSQKENVSQIDMYPTVMMDPEDYYG